MFINVHRVDLLQKSGVREHLPNLNWLIIKFCCLIKIISSLEKTETCNLFIADYELYLLYLLTTASNFATRSCTVIKLFNRYLYDMKHM